VDAAGGCGRIPNVEGEVRRAAAGAPSDVAEEGVELSHALDTIEEILDGDGGFRRKVLQAEELPVLLLMLEDVVDDFHHWHRVHLSRSIIVKVREIRPAPDTLSCPFS
jgi:hypothetical protein